MSARQRWKRQQSMSKRKQNTDEAANMAQPTAPATTVSDTPLQLLPSGAKIDHKVICPGPTPHVSDKMRPETHTVRVRRMHFDPEHDPMHPGEQRRYIDVYVSHLVSGPAVDYLLRNTSAMGRLCMNPHPHDVTKCTWIHYIPGVIPMTI